MAVDYFPLDFDGLNKGDRIEADRVTEIVGVPTVHPHYQLKVMALVQKIERELGDRGKHLTVCQNKGAILMLTDEQASDMTARRCVNHRRGYARDLCRMLHVDPGQLDDQGKRLHAERVRRHSAVVAAMNREARRKAIPSPRPASQQALPNPKSQIPNP